VPADFLKAYSPVFAAMKQHDLVLKKNIIYIYLHGEWPGRPPNDDISLEEAFLSELKRLHEKFPRLRCVLELNRPSLLTAQYRNNTSQHCSTAAA
jgi:dihydroorotase